MNTLQLPSATDTPRGTRRLKKLGLVAVLAFTLKGLVTVVMLVITLLEFTP